MSLHKSKHLLVVAFCLLPFAFAHSQQPREFPRMVREALHVDNERLLPAPAGWGIPLIGVTNIARQHLASIIFYNDALRPYSELSLPQTILHDITPLGSAGGGASLVALVEQQDSFHIFSIDSHRVIGAGVVLDTGANDLVPAKTGASFAGVSISSASHDTLIIIQFDFFDQPLRHVIAAYTLRGTAVWKMLIGAATLRSAVPEGFDGEIIFSTDAAMRETADTVRLSSKKAHVGVIAQNGMLQWERAYAGEGTATWCIPLAERAGVLCAIRRADSAEVLLLDAHSGHERHFTRITGSIAPRTLSIIGNTISVAIVPNQIVQFDTLLRPLRTATLAWPIDMRAASTTVTDSASYSILYDSNRTEIFNGEFILQGFVDAGMARCIGLAGQPHTTFIALNASGASLRTIEPNDWWLWFRWRITALIVVIGIILLVTVIYAARRFTFYRTYYNQLVRGSITTGVVAINRQLRVIHLNNAARELLHIAPYIPLQRHITEYMPGAEYADILNDVREALQTRTAHEKIVTLQTGSQPRTLLARARPTLTRNGMLAGCLLQLEDITRTIERERLMSWAAVAHHVAHEMKTPIGTVLLNAQHVLKSEEELPERAKKYFHRIVTQAERLSGILQNFLSIARVSSMRFARVDIARFIQSLAADYAELLPSHITMQCNIGELADPDLDIDEQQLTTALRNILDNAIHAITPRDGSITISLDEYPMPPAGGVSIGVQDTGKGMSEECRARMFEPFFTETPGGSGIGMVIVKRIVDEHKGFIEVTSVEGEGTEVKIIIPRNAG